jgi:hypothetical protein
MKKGIGILLLALTTSAYADFSIQLDAGRLRQSAATAMAAGSLLILVEAGGDGTFSNNLAAGQYVSGNDILLSATAFPNSAAAFNTSGGTDETVNLFTNLSTANPGDLVALRWFPGITYAQWQGGATPTAGQVFGTYNPLAAGNGTNNPDGGDLWAVPSQGTINLNFFTTDSGGGGTQAPATGFASFTVTAIPEPSITLLSLLGAGIGGALLRRSNKRS